MKGRNVDRYTYTVSWSPDDEVFIGRVLEFRSLAAHGDTPEEAMAEIKAVVTNVLEDLEKSGEEIPQPFSERRYSGKFQVRLSPDLHRRLAMEAERQNISINQLVTMRLSAG